MLSWLSVPYRTTSTFSTWLTIHHLHGIACSEFDIVHRSENIKSLHHCRKSSPSLPLTPFSSMDYRLIWRSAILQRIVLCVNSFISFITMASRYFLLFICLSPSFNWACFSVFWIMWKRNCSHWPPTWDKPLFTSLFSRNSDQKLKFNRSVGSFTWGHSTPFPPHQETAADWHLKIWVALKHEL